MTTPFRPKPSCECEAGRRITFPLYPEWTRPCSRPAAETVALNSDAVPPLRLCEAHAALLPVALEALDR